MMRTEPTRITTPNGKTNEGICKYEAVKEPFVNWHAVKRNRIMDGDGNDANRIKGAEPKSDNRYHERR